MKMQAEIERLRGIIARNCDWGQAKVLSSEKTDAEAIKAICDAADAARVEDVPSAKFNPVSIIGPIEQGHAASELPQPLTDTPPKHSHYRAITNGTIERCAQVAEALRERFFDHPMDMADAIAAAIRKLKDETQ